MSLSYIRKAYNVPAYRGARVRFKAREGTITSGTHVVRPDDQPNARLRFQPSDLQYEPVGNQ